MFQKGKFTLKEATKRARNMANRKFAGDSSNWNTQRQEHRRTKDSPRYSDAKMKRKKHE